MPGAAASLAEAAPPLRVAHAHPPGAVAAPAPGPKAIPLAADFLDQMLDASGKTARFALPDGREALGTVELVRRDGQGVLLVQGRLSRPAPGRYFFQRQTVEGKAGSMVGNVRFDVGEVAYRVEPSGVGGAPVLVETTVDDVVCHNFTAPDPARVAAAEPPQDAPQAHPINIPIPGYQEGIVPLQSLPGATGVIYLDFDGEPGPFSGWGDFDAAPSNATNAQIKEVWQRVAEDYQPFNLNVTTDRKVFDNAAQGRRQHVLLTPTTTAAPGAGGVAYIGSYNWSGDTVTWSFYSTGKSAAEVVSHEVGHTLNLGHDGRTTPSEGYYGGHGSGDVGWAPIMGVGYYKNLVQWSKGEYLSANNTQDDLAILVGNNNDVDYRVDDFGATFATAPYLEILANNSVSNEGIIETRADVDAFRFTTAGGPVSLVVSTVSAGPNVDILAEIYDSADTLVASANPDTGLSATVAATLAAGDYTLRVSGVGRGDPLVDGYTDYASLGAYLISGSVTGGVKPDRFTVAENSAAGTPAGTVTPRNAHDASPLTFVITSGNGTGGGAFAIDPATGAITVADVAQMNFEALSLRWDDLAMFELFVSITDSVDPLLNETVRVVVTVSGLNEAPTVTGGALTMLDHTAIGTKVLEVSGSDPDRFDFPTFSITAGNTGGAFAIDASTGQITVAADTDASVQSVYTLTVRATDQNATPLGTDATVTITLIAVPAGYTPGTIKRTYYEGISGNAVTDLILHGRYPGQPDSEESLSAFDGGAHGDNFGSTLRGYLIPPVTGSYKFWIASDDASVLLISSDATPSFAVQRASVSGATNQYQWTKYASQQSVSLALTAGTPYYIEARHKEGGGGDHVAVAWQGPGIAQQVIPALYLAPHVQNYHPRWPTEPYTFSVAEDSANGTPVGTVAATDLNGDLLTYTIESGNTGGAFAVDAPSGTITVANRTALVGGQSISLRMTAQDDGGGGVFPQLQSSTTVTIDVLQTLRLLSPMDNPVNIPAGTGVFIEADNHGRTGTAFAWTQESGPGTATFDNAAVLATGVTFSMPGTYMLRCTETGGANAITLDLTVNAGFLDYGFTASLVGAQAVAPSHTASAGSYSISAAGGGIPSSGTPDDFYFLNVPVTGNVTITARVVSVEDIDGSSSRAGVMIRETLAANSRHAFCGVTAANGGRFIYRATAGANSANATVTVAQPYWVRLTRSDDSFTAQRAPDSSGTPGTFTALGTAQTLAMSSNVFVGLAASSGSTTTAGTIVIDNVTITPSEVNIGPTVNVGNDASIAFPAGATLDGTVTDDGKPAPPGAFTTAWSKVAGPAGIVTFGNAAAVDTTASFPLPGVYTLRLTADDGAVKTFDQVAITVLSNTTITIAATDPNAGEQVLNPGEFTITRSGSTAGALTVSYTIGGTATAGSDYTAMPTSVVFADGQATATLALVPSDDAFVEGAETVIITLDPGQYNVGTPGDATVTITDNDVVPSVTITSPTAPIVNLPAAVGLVLEATATDDGQPGPLVFTWSRVSGPGTVTFGSASSANTTATFSVAGAYVLRLTASDGQFSASDDVTVHFGVANVGAKVGTQAIAPSHTLAAGTCTISAAGAGIPSTSTPDDFYFINVPAAGDVTITARLVSVQAVNGSNSRAGVMIRESLAANARHAFCGVNSAGSGRFIYRATAGSNSANAQATAAFPYWIRLTRTGNVFTARFAPDSSGAPGTWTTAGNPQTLSMGSTAYIGLASTSGSATAAGAIVFDNLSLSAANMNVAPRVAAGSDGAVTLPAAATLDGTVTDDALPASPGAVTTTWSKAGGPGAVTFGNAAAVDTNATFAAAGSHVLRLITDDGEVKTFDDVAIAVQSAPIELWRLAKFGADAGNPTIAGDLADPDFDGLSNLLEYALGLEPLTNSASAAIGDLETIGAEHHLRLTVTRNPAATDITFAVEVTGTLALPAPWTTTGTTIEANTPTLLRVRDNTPTGTVSARFIRLKVTRP